MKIGDLFKLHPVNFTWNPIENIAKKLPLDHALRIRFTGNVRIPLVGDWIIGGSSKDAGGKTTLHCTPYSTATFIRNPGIYTISAYIGELVEVKVTEQTIRRYEPSEYSQELED